MNILVEGFLADAQARGKFIHSEVGALLKIERHALRKKLVKGNQMGTP